MFTRAAVGLLVAFAVEEVCANPPAVVVGQVYACPNGRSIKILECSPDGTVCDVQAYNEQGQPVVRGKNTLAQLQGAIAQCPPRGAPPAAAAAAPPAGRAAITSAPRAAGGPPKPGLAS